MTGRNILSERHVQAIWYDKALRPSALMTARGSPVTVVHPGDWNTGAGPDFLNAVITVGNRTLRGDVEIHLRPADWDVHGHGDNPAYQEIIAHVTWFGGPTPNSLPAGAVSIRLARFVTARTDFSLDQIDLSAYPYSKLPDGERPCATLLANAPDDAECILDEAGRCRMQEKARRFEHFLSKADSRQIFYAEILRALGYARNAEAFRALADTVPLSMLEAEPENAAAALIAASGFISIDRYATRPHNRPERRLVAAANLFVNSSIMTMVDVSDFSSHSCRDMLRTITTGRSVGTGRAAAIIANVILPFAIATGHTTHIPDWLPPEDVSAPVRLTARRLFGPSHNPLKLYASNGLRIHGLLHLYREFCLHHWPGCEECPLSAT